jgi:hypothetical protein
MAPQRKLFVLFVLVLALAALVPGAEAKKKRASMRAIARAPAPMPAAAPMAAMGAGRMLLEGAPKPDAGGCVMPFVRSDACPPLTLPRAPPPIQTAARLVRVASAAAARVVSAHCARGLTCSVSASRCRTGMEVPVEAPSKPIAAAAQVAATQATPPAAATEQPAEPVEEGAAPAPSEGEEQDRNKPAAAWAQCGGTAPSSETNATWAGPTTCEEGATCVHLSATYSQCIPIKQSRGYGCSAVYAQCGGADPGVTTAWSGAYCCPVRSSAAHSHTDVHSSLLTSRAGGERVRVLVQHVQPVQAVQRQMGAVVRARCDAMRQVCCQH